MLSRFASARALQASRILFGSPIAQRLNVSTGSVAAGFIERNEALKRPTSPHMLIYAWPITSLTSGSHRVTGTLMSLAIYGLGGAMFAATGHSTDVVNWIAELQIHPLLMMNLKAMFVWPLCYHTVNGFRHFVWDIGYGYEKKTFTAVGLTVVATSIAIAFIVANLKPKKRIEAPEQ